MRLLHRRVVQVDGEGGDVEGVVAGGAERPEHAGREAWRVGEPDAAVAERGLDPFRLGVGRRGQLDLPEGQRPRIGLAGVGGTPGEGDPRKPDAVYGVRRRDEVPGRGLRDEVRTRWAGLRLE